MRLPITVGAMVVLAGGCFVESRRDYADFYESCQATSDCRAGADACFFVAWVAGEGGRMCSAYCESDAECPGVSACYELVGDPSAAQICYARCDSELDCEPSFTCADATAGGGTVIDSICLPL